MLRLEYLKRSIIGMFCVLFGLAAAAFGQTPPTQELPAKPAPQSANSADFVRITDEVMAQMSKILGLAQLEPLKKTLRSREEIRAYVLKQMDEDKEPEKRYADERFLEKLGLLPKNFPFDSFLVDLLTEQIAGLYDPKAREFYIADWMDPKEQKVVMAHELTHALQDQHYHIDAWRDKAKPNDDAETARDAVLEGAATAAMIDYGLREQGSSLDAVYAANVSLSSLLGNLDGSPLLMKAPAFLRDSLEFPYSAGGDFCLAVLRDHGDWPGFDSVFQKPPVSTQQILHPELYFRGVVPVQVTLPDLTRDLPGGWKVLDSNIMGEFGLQEILKEFLSEDRADELAPLWVGDRYTIYEKKDTKDGKDIKEDLLVYRVKTATVADATRLFGGFSEALEKKYKTRNKLVRRPNYFSFDSDEGGVFLRCVGADCVVSEGGDAKLFDKLVRELGWPVNPTSSAPVASDGIKAESVSEYKL